MDVKFIERIKRNLGDKRQNLATWLATETDSTKEVRLGPADEKAVVQNLEVLDQAVEKAEAGTFGICVVCHESVDEDLLEMDYTTKVCLDHYSPDEVRNLERELELSEIVQKALLPQAAPDIPGLEAAAFFRPAQIVGGDFYDFLQFRNGMHGFAIADVAGKGMSAGLIMASIQTALRTLAPISDTPVDVLNELNRLFSHNIHFTTFVTLFLGVYDPLKQTLTYSNAGHNPPLVYRKRQGYGDSTQWLEPTGAAIGLVENPQLQEKTVQLSPGDILLLYTDGVTEAFDEQRGYFGGEGLVDFMCRNADLPIKEIIRELWKELAVFTRGLPLADDTTILVSRAIE